MSLRKNVLITYEHIYFCSSLYIIISFNLISFITILFYSEAKSLKFNMFNPVQRDPPVGHFFILPSGSVHHRWVTRQKNKSHMIIWRLIIAHIKIHLYTTVLYPFVYRPCARFDSVTIVLYVTVSQTCLDRIW